MGVQKILSKEIYSMDRILKRRKKLANKSSNNYPYVLVKSAPAEITTVSKFKADMAKSQRGLLQLNIQQQLLWRKKYAALREIIASFVDKEQSQLFDQAIKIMDSQHSVARKK